MRKTHVLLVVAAILAVAVPTAAFAGDGSGAPNGIGATLAGLLCKQEGASIGKDAFRAKYGKDAPAACAKAQNAAVKAALDACRGSSSASDARTCAAAKLGLPAGKTGQGQSGSDQGQSGGQGQSGQGQSGGQGQNGQDQSGKGGPPPQGGSGGQGGPPPKGGSGQGGPPPKGGPGQGPGK